MRVSAKGKQKKSKEEEQTGILEVLRKHFNLKTSIAWQDYPFLGSSSATV